MMTLFDRLTLAFLAAIALLPFIALLPAKQSNYICIGYCVRGVQDAE